MDLRPVDEIVDCETGTEGDGFVVRRGIERLRAQQLDPFVHLDEMVRTTYRPGEAVGTPDHPHRGFETVTYMIEGSFVHRDSLGNGGRIDAGDAQWMTAGEGIVHSEKPAPEIVENGGALWGLQLWVNLPAAQKRSPARYQAVTRDEIPRVDHDGAEVRVIAGAYGDARGPAATHTPITLDLVTVRPGGSVDFDLPADHNVGFQVLAGSGWVGTDARPLHDGQLAAFGRVPGTVRFGVPADASEPMIGLLMAGRPIGEPVARYGPFVMNTVEELQEAVDDMVNGRLGSIPAVEP